ncbi:MAG: hypothetical protein ACM3H8_15635 [Sphingobacteriales bacterium]
MSQTNQYYFSVPKLEALIQRFNNSSPVAGKGLKGFVFVPGFDNRGISKVFAYPVYGDQGGGGDDILVQNLDITMAACPYPPGCQ